MNTKRQTVWLVSMLSLMVILSAYYLFTDNVNEIDNASKSENSGQLVTIDEINLDEHVASKDSVKGSLVDDLTEATLIDSLKEMDITIPNNQILENIKAGARTGDEYLSVLIMNRNDALNKETERLVEITADPKRTSEEMAKAQDELARLEDMHYRISDLEDQLMQEFENVVITEEKGKWKAVVKADKLERSQAVSIIDMMITNLQITSNKIAGVQFVK